MLRLISVNIEGDCHLDRVIPFLEKEQADIVCLQEVFEADLPRFKKELAMHAYFVPTVILEPKNPHHRMSPKGLWGLAIVSTHALNSFHSLYYADHENVSGLPYYTEKDPDGRKKALAIAEIVVEQQLYKILTTHFTWSHDGKPTQRQQDHLSKLLSLLEKEDEFVLCGDFNAPRGRMLWNKIAQKYKDNIPLSVNTTIDGNLHQAGPIPYVVDGLFTTPLYKVENVRVISGVSDHMAIVADVRKKSS